MPLDQLAGKLVVPSRQQLHDRYLLWSQIHAAQYGVTIDTRLGGQVDLDANVWADASSLILNRAVIVANGVSRSTATGPALDTWAQLMGTQRQPAVGAGGSIAAVFAASGGQVIQGDILTYLQTGAKYQVTSRSAVYPPGTPITISGITTGPQTNLPAGAQLKWLSVRNGVSNPLATVLPTASGDGLTGGNNAEKDSELQARLQLIASNPPASGNDSAYQKAINEVLGIGVQAAFTFPGVRGPGTIGIMFLLRPGTPGASRIPTAAQMAAVLNLVGGQFPADDGIFMCAVVPSPVNLALKVIWAQSADGWSDSTLFPLYHPGQMVSASTNSAGAITATAFRVGSPAMSEVPQPGQSIAFLDLPNQTFRRKKILTVTQVSATQCDVTVDTTSGVSDVSYTPFIGQPCCPWSDSLDSLIDPVLTYFDALGPGEQFSGFFDPGLRQKRSPPTPQFWPNQLTNRVLGGAIVPQPPQGPQQNQPPVPTLYTTTTLNDVSLAEPVAPYPTPVGIPGVSSNLLTMQALVAFPE